MRFLALLFSVPLFAQSEVLVQLYNTVGVPAPQLKEALRIAGRVMSPAGITVRWQECPASCEEPGSGAVYILGLAGPQLEMPTPKALGFSMLATGKGNRGAVSLPRVEEFAEANSVAVEAVLAYSIIHELGHLITRSKRHSKGVMMAQWSRAEALSMGLSRLTFSPEDVQSMRRALAPVATNRRTAE